MLEECAAGPYADLSSGTGPFTPASPGALGAMLQRQHRDLGSTLLEPEITLSGAAGIPRDHMTIVRVTVTWRERSGRHTLVRERRISGLSAR